MANDEAALIEFVQGIDWDKYADDEDVLDILSKIKNRVEEMDDGEEEDDPDRRAKVVVVGDGAVGKTCLFITFATGKFPEDYVPTVFENYTHDTVYKNEPFMLHMWDTAGQEDYDRLRPLSYPGTDVVVICFSLVNESTFESVRMKWSPEINRYLEGTPKILVGTKSDMRDQKITDGALTKYEEITTEEGKELAKEIGAVAYIESSAKTEENLKLVFEKVIEAALANKDIDEDEEPVKPKKEAPVKEKKKKKSSKTEATEGTKKRRKKSSKRENETDEEKKERRRKRRERKEKEGKEGKPRKTRKTKDEKKERKRKRSKTDSDKKKKKEK